MVLQGEGFSPRVRVLFDGIAAPVLSTRDTEILTIVPYALQGRDWVAVVVEKMGQRSGAIPVMMVDANPALFTVNGLGSGQAVAENADGSPNGPGNPAAPGAFLTLYGTGEGVPDRAAPAPALDGRLMPAEPWLLPIPALPVTVWIGGEEAGLLYAGAVPGGTAGKLQLVVQVPRTLPAGEREVTMQVGLYRGRGA